MKFIYINPLAVCMRKSNVSYNFVLKIEFFIILWKKIKCTSMKTTTV